MTIYDNLPRNAIIVATTTVALIASVLFLNSRKKKVKNVLTRESFINNRNLSWFQLASPENDNQGSVTECWNFERKSFWRSHEISPSSKAISPCLFCSSSHIDPLRTLILDTLFDWQIILSSSTPKAQISGITRIVHGLTISKQTIQTIYSPWRKVWGLWNEIQCL